MKRPTLLSAAALLLCSCGALLGSDYTDRLAAYQSQLDKDKAEILATERASVEAKAQVIALQSAQAASQAKLDVALANLGRAQAVPTTPPEVLAALSGLVTSLKAETASSQSGVDELTAFRKELAARHDDLANQRSSDAAEMQRYKVESAGKAAQQGTSLLGPLLGGGGLLASLLALIATKTGKSRSQPEIDQQWEEIASLKAQLAETRGRLALPVPIPPVTHV